MNKNQKRVQAAIRLARRQGKSEVDVQKPVYNYHSDSKMTTVKRQVTNGKGVVSKNTARNMQMKVLSNAGGGVGSSLTVHEKIDNGYPARPKPRTDDCSKNKDKRRNRED